MSARMNPSRQLALGALIVSTLTMLAYFTLFLTESSLFGDKEQITITFDQARGLRAGDSVLVAGVRWGRVAEVEYDSSAALDSRITVVATLTNPVEFREGGSFQIQDSTLLGGRVLSIDPGPPGATPLPMDHPYQGAVVTSPLDAMGEFLAENSVSFKNTLDGVSTLLLDANEGTGVLGSLLKDEDLAANLKKTAANVEKITDSLSEGKSTIGRLLMAGELIESIERSAADFEKILASARKTTDGIEAGVGPVGTLLKDEEMAADMREIVASIRQVTADLEAGEGNLGKLLKDDAIYENARKITENLDLVVAKVKAGEGLLGQIIMSDDLFSEVQYALGLITRTLEEYREAAPVSTMTSVLFSAF